MIITSCVSVVLISCLMSSSQDAFSWWLTSSHQILPQKVEASLGSGALFQVFF